jgi:hypothetical protein
MLRDASKHLRPDLSPADRGRRITKSGQPGPQQGPGWRARENAAFVLHPRRSSRRASTWRARVLGQTRVTRARKADVRVGLGWSLTRATSRSATARSAKRLWLGRMASPRVGPLGHTPASSKLTLGDPAVRPPPCYNFNSEKSWRLHYLSPGGRNARTRGQRSCETAPEPRFAQLNATPLKVRERAYQIGIRLALGSARRSYGCSGMLVHRTICRVKLRTATASFLSWCRRMFARRTSQTRRRDIHAERSWRTRLHLRARGLGRKFAPTKKPVTPVVT